MLKNFSLHRPNNLLVLALILFSIGIGNPYFSQEGQVILRTPSVGSNFTINDSIRIERNTKYYLPIGAYSLQAEGYGYYPDTVLFNLDSGRVKIIHLELKKTPEHEAFLASIADSEKRRKRVSKFINRVFVVNTLAHTGTIIYSQLKADQNVKEMESIRLFYNISFLSDSLSKHRLAFLEQEQQYLKSTKNRNILIGTGIASSLLFGYLIYRKGGFKFEPKRFKEHSGISINPSKCGVFLSNNQLGFTLNFSIL